MNTHFIYLANDGTYVPDEGDFFTSPALVENNTFFNKFVFNKIVSNGSFQTVNSGSLIGSVIIPQDGYYEASFMFIFNSAVTTFPVFGDFNNTLFAALYITNDENGHNYVVPKTESYIYNRDTIRTVFKAKKGDNLSVVNNATNILESVFNTLNDTPVTTLGEIETAYYLFLRKVDEPFIYLINDGNDDVTVNGYNGIFNSFNYTDVLSNGLSPTNSGTEYGSVKINEKGFYELSYTIIGFGTSAEKPFKTALYSNGVNNPGIITNSPTAIEESLGGAHFTNDLIFRSEGGYFISLINSSENKQTTFGATSALNNGTIIGSVVDYSLLVKKLTVPTAYLFNDGSFSDGLEFIEIFPGATFADGNGLDFNNFQFNGYMENITDTFEPQYSGSFYGSVVIKEDGFYRSCFNTYSAIGRNPEPPVFFATYVKNQNETTGHIVPNSAYSVSGKGTFDVVFYARKNDQLSIINNSLEFFSKIPNMNPNPSDPSNALFGVVNSYSWLLQKI